jgi:hypothetical protein
MEGASKPDKEAVMNAIIANIMTRAAPQGLTDGGFLTIALYCGVGLLISLFAVFLGLDLGFGL